MKFSIIIGAYKQTQYLPTLLEAYNSQTFKDFEVHYCDTRNEAKKWVKENTNWHYHSCFSRILGKKVNKAIKKVKGDYCVFIMGDSYPHPEFLEIINQYISPNAVVCGSRLQIDENKVVSPDWRLLKEVIPPFPTLLAGDQYGRVTGNGLVVPTKAFQNYSYPVLRKYGGDDDILAAKLFADGYVFYSVPQAIIYHFYHKEKFEDEKTRKLVRRKIKRILSRDR